MLLPSRCNVQRSLPLWTRFNLRAMPSSSTMKLPRDSPQSTASTSLILFSFFFYDTHFSLQDLEKKRKHVLLNVYLILFSFQKKKKVGKNRDIDQGRRRRRRRFRSRRRYIGNLNLIRRSIGEGCINLRGATVHKSSHLLLRFSKYAALLRLVNGGGRRCFKLDRDATHLTNWWSRKSNRIYGPAIIMGRIGRDLTRVERIRWILTLVDIKWRQFLLLNYFVLLNCVRNFWSPAFFFS